MARRDIYEWPLGIIHKWRHTVLDNFDPLPSVTIFCTKTLVLPSQIHWPSPWGVTSFMDYPLADKMYRLARRSIQLMPIFYQQAAFYNHFESFMHYLMYAYEIHELINIICKPLTDFEDRGLRLFVFPSIAVRQGCTTLISWRAQFFLAISKEPKLIRIYTFKGVCKKEIRWLHSTLGFAGHI